MALTVTTKYIHPPNYAGTPPTTGGFKRVIVHLTGRCGVDSNNVDESAVKKIDISTLTKVNGVAPIRTVVESIEWNISGFSNVLLQWDRTTDATIATLSGTGKLCRDIVDNSTGDTGDILLTTFGASAGATYDILLNVRLK